MQRLYLPESSQSFNHKNHGSDVFPDSDCLFLNIFNTVITPRNATKAVIVVSIGISVRCIVAVGHATIVVVVVPRTAAKARTDLTYIPFFTIQIINLCLV